MFEGMVKARGRPTRPKSQYRRLNRLANWLNQSVGAEEPDQESLSYLREYNFRRRFGGSHDDFMNQPLEVTEMLIALDARLGENSSGD